MLLVFCREHGSLNFLHNLFSDVELAVLFVFKYNVITSILLFYIILLTSNIILSYSILFVTMLFRSLSVLPVRHKFILVTIKTAVVYVIHMCVEVIDVVVKAR